MRDDTLGDGLQVPSSLPWPKTPKEGEGKLLLQEEDGRLGAARRDATTGTGRSAPPGQQGGRREKKGQGRLLGGRGVEAQGGGRGS